MKKMKKMVALLLGVVMAMAMSVTVFANKTVDVSTHSFTAYQIFSATSIDADGKLGNIAWGDGISEEGKTAIYTKYGITDDETKTAAENEKAKLTALVTTLSAMDNDSTEAREFAQLAYTYRVDGKGTAVTSGSTKLPIGYYVVEDTTTGDAASADDFEYNLSVLRVSDNSTPVTITSKVDVPEVNKVILDPDETKLNEAGIGETVNYQITGTLPTQYADFETYFMRFTDTLSKGLTYTADSLKVYAVNGSTKTDITSDAMVAVSVGDYSTTDGTSILVTIKDTKKVTAAEVSSSTVFYVEYSAVVNKNAIIAGEGNPNTVKLTYYNNPDNSGKPTDTPPSEPEHPTGVTPNSTVKTYVTELTIKKTDEAGAILQGAEFTLSAKDGKIIKMVVKNATVFTEAADGTYWKLKDGSYTTTDPATEKIDQDDYDSTTVKYSKEVVTSYEATPGSADDVKAFVGDDGTVTFTGLCVGEYTITESVTPTGFNTIDPITFNVTFNNTTGKFSADNGITLEDDNTLYTEIVNKKGSTLPSTGGIGTTIFYVLGLILVFGAGVLLISKRRVARR